MPYKYGFNNWDETEYIDVEEDATNVIQTHQNGEQEFSVNNSDICISLAQDEHNLIQQTPAVSYETFGKQNASMQTRKVGIHVMQFPNIGFIAHRFSFSYYQSGSGRTRKEPLLFRSSYFKVEHDDGVIVKAKCSACKSQLTAKCGVSSNFITHLKV